MVLKPCKSWDKLPSPQLVSLPDLWLPSTVGGRWQPVLYLPKTILISRVWSPWALSCRTSSSLCVFKGSSTFRPVTEVCLSNLFLDMYIYIYIHIIYTYISGLQVGDIRIKALFICRYLPIQRLFGVADI